LPSNGVWQDIFGMRRVDQHDRVSAGELFANFPMAVLIAERSRGEV
jgi:hypothetical protein